MNVGNILSCINKGISYHVTRSFSGSSVNNGMRNFTKFELLNRGTAFEKKRRLETPDRNELGWSHGVRHPGYWIGNRFVEIPEMIPEIVVPDLTDCPLRPYVSYRCADVEQPEFTARDLFDAVYGDKIEKDFAENKLDEHGNPLEPSDDEKLTPTEAFNRARKTNSDLFVQDRPYPRIGELHGLE